MLIREVTAGKELRLRVFAAITPVILMNYGLPMMAVQAKSFSILMKAMWRLLEKKLL
jgi:hypothetical protein